jgi:hypothetical protein
MINVDKFVYNDEDVLEFIVLKHGDHDQSSHGNWATGGVSRTLTQSVLDRVKANGGLSVNMRDGSEPTKGYMVASPVKKAPVVDADDFYDPIKGRKILGDFVKANKKDLGGGKKYLGLWHNKEDNKVYLDVSENVQDKGTATRLGRQRNQISIWDVVNFEEIGTGGTGVTEKRRDSDGGVTIRYIGDDGRTNRFLGGFDLQQNNEVEKHGTHDQSSHAGSRRRIGSDSTEAEPKRPKGEQEVTDPDAPKPKLKPGRKPDASGSLEERAEKLANGERIQVTKGEAKKFMKIMARREDNPDLTNMHIEDTQLYDEDNLGIPRNKMPQVPSDTKAVFISEMEKRGARVQRGVADPSKLHPIQEEMSASKVGLIMKKLRQKGMKTDDGGRIIISKDNFVIDGHHRWAAAAMLSFEDSSVKLPVIRVDMNHKDLIAATLAWNDATGIKPVGMGESNKPGQIRKAWAEFDYIIAKSLRGRTIVRFQPGLRPTLKHLSGQHDQQTHGSWAGYKSGDEESWGKERASALKAMENAGPTKQEILDAMTGAGNRVIPEDILDDDSYRLWVENNSRYYAEIVGQTVTSAQYESWRDANNIDDSSWSESTKYSRWQESEGITAVEEVYDQTLNDFIERGKEDGWLTDRVMESDGYIQNDELEWFSEDNFGEGLQDLSNKFRDVYDFTKSITLNDSNTKDTISSAVTDVQRAGNRLRVNGEVFNSKGENLGSFEREFYQDEDGSLVVDHDLLSIEDPAYTGNGFGTDFHMRQENYYITHGVDKVYVHAALDVGGYMWAKMGFQFDENKSESSKARIGDRIANFVDDTEYTDSQTSAVLSNYRDRLYDTDNSNDPEPWEIHALRDNRTDKKSTVGKDILLGSNWFGVKYMTPTGRENNTGQSDLARDESFSTWRVDDKVIYNQITGEVTGQLELGLGA